METTNLLITIFLIYIAVGFFFALYFVFKGVGKTDDGAKEISLPFRLLILPGSIAFWPFLLEKLMKASKK